MSAHKFLWLVCFWPLAINLTGSASQSQMIFVSIFGVFAILFILLKRRVQLPLQELFLLFGVAMLLLLSSLVNGLPLERIISDVSRFLMFGLFVTLGFNLSVANSDDVADTIVKIAIAQILFSLFVYVPGLWPILDLFKARLSSDPLPFHFMRFSGALGFPTEFSLFILLALAIVGHRFLKVPLRSATFQLIPFSILSLGIFFSVSRSGLLGAALLLCTLYLYFVRSVLILRPAMRFFLPTLLVLSLVVALVWNIQLLLGADRLSLLGYLDISSGVDESILHRFSEIQCGLRALTGDQGVIKNICGLGVVESTFGFFLIRHSIIGLVAYVLWLAFILYSIYLFRTRGSNQRLFWGLAFILVAYLVTFAPFSEALMRSKGVVVFGSILGIAFNLLRREINSGRSNIS